MGNGADRDFRAVQNDPETNMRALWNKYDTNKDGILSKGETKKFLQDAQEFLNLKDKSWSKSVMLQYDKNSDGELSWDEFSKTVKDILVLQANAELADLVSQEDCNLKDLKKLLSYRVPEKIHLVEDSGGRTFLYLAARAGNSQAVLELLNFAPCDIDNQKTPKDQSTPTHAAAWFQHSICLALLLAAGASSCVKNSHNLTPRDEAQGPCRQVFKEFEEHGVKGLKKSYPFIRQLKNVKTRPPEVRVKKPLALPSHHFEGILDFTIISSRISQEKSACEFLISVLVEIDAHHLVSPPVLFTTDIKWNFKATIPIRTFHNLPIKISIIDQDENAHGMTSIPISLIASKGAIEEAGRTGTVEKSFGLIRHDGNSLTDSNIKTLFHFTEKKLSSEELQQSRQVMDLFVSSGKSKKSHITLVHKTGDQFGREVNKPMSQVPLIETRSVTLNKTKSSTRLFRIFQASEGDFKSQVLYQESDLLAHGSFGYVYKGVLAGDSERKLAIKIIQDTKNKEELIKEVEVQSLFNCYEHPHLLPVLMAFQTPFFFSILMPLCTANTLKQILSEKSLPRRYCIRIWKTNFKRNPVPELHSAGYCHRDLKPENIMFVGDSLLNLIDFGSCDRCSDGSLMYGITGCTPWYAPPELFSPLGYTSSVDLYAAGTIIFELIFGDVPWWYDMATDEDIGAAGAHECWAIDHPIQWGSLVYPSALRGQTLQLMKGLIETDRKKRIDLRTAFSLISV